MYLKSQTDGFRSLTQRGLIACIIFMIQDQLHLGIHKQNSRTGYNVTSFLYLVIVQPTNAYSQVAFYHRPTNAERKDSVAEHFLGANKDLLSWILSAPAQRGRGQQPSAPVSERLSLHHSRQICTVSVNAHSRFITHPGPSPTNETAAQA